MSFLNALYLQRPHGDPALPEGLRGRVHAGNEEWTMIQLASAAAIPAATLERFAQGIGAAVVHLAFASDPATFTFALVVDGEVVRRLHFDAMGGATWKIIDGRPEPWEGEIFAEADPQLGEAQPGLDPHLAAQGIAEVYGLPTAV